MVLGETLAKEAFSFFPFRVCCGGHIKAPDGDRDVAFEKFFDVSFIRLVQTIQMELLRFFLPAPHYEHGQLLPKNILGRVSRINLTWQLPTRNAND